jgi:ElaB/YqjD/DUF883 family membrane-anchored ribosome-binding protein
MSEYQRQNPGLAYEPTNQEFGSTESRGEKSPEEIEREIEETRNRMSQNIDELGDRLNPQNLKQQAKDSIRNAASDAVSNVGEQARRTGFRLVDVIRDNPLPVIAVGAGVTWLLTQRSRSEISGNRMARYSYTGPDRRQYEGRQYAGRQYEGRQFEGFEENEFEGQSRGIKGRVGDAVSGVKDKVSGTTSGIAEKAGELASGTKERVGQIGWQARRQTDRVKTKVGHAATENPLAVAAGAAILGMAIGLLLPETERENEMMGSARDQLVDRAERTAERVKDAATEAGREVKDAVKTEISERKGEVKQVVQEAGMMVKEQVKESAKKVKNQAKQAATESRDESASGTANNPTMGTADSPATGRGNNPRSTP